MRVLVTGCRGFIGGAVGREAVRAGHTVLGIGRAAQAPVEWSGAYLAADVISADLAGVVREFAPEIVFHGAGSASVGASFSAPGEDLRATVQAFGQVLEAIRRAEVRPLVVFPSSAAVYGCPAALPVREDAAMAPLSPYGFHKQMCELLAREYAACFGLRVVVCRLFSVFGPGQRRLLVHQLHEQFLAGAPEVRLQGTGEETRDYLFIDDLAALVRRVAEAEARRREEAGVVTVNVASGQSTRVLALAQILGCLLDSQKPVRVGEHFRLGDPPFWQAEVARLREYAGDFQGRPLEEGLRACLAVWGGVNRAENH